MIEALRRVPSVVSFFGVVVIVPILCVASGVTSITVSPSPPQLGWTTKYTIVPTDGEFPLAYSFQYRCTAGGGTPSDWTTPYSNGTAVFNIQEPYVGTQDIKGGEQTYLPNFTQQWLYLVQSITVAGPDTETITAGLNSDSADEGSGVNADYYVDVNFSISVGTVLVGPFASCTVEERIRRPQFQTDSGWSEAVDTLYSWQPYSGYIFDHKTVNQSYVDSIAIGTVFDDFYQQNRMIVGDCFGDEQIFLFPEHHFQKTKTSGGTWQLSEL